MQAPPTGPMSFARAAQAGTTTRAGFGELPISVFRVTSLEDYEGGNTPIPGTLRHALRAGEDAEGRSMEGRARAVVFDVAGEIRLVEPIQGDGRTLPNTWVMGQTAPGRVVVTGRPIIIAASHFIMEHMTLRPGVPERIQEADSQDGLSIRSDFNLSDVRISNCSVEQSVDELLSISPIETGITHRNISILNCLFGDAFSNPPIRHEDRHNFGIFLRRRSLAVEIGRNMIDGCRRRIPGVEQGTTSIVYDNLIYDWGAGHPHHALTKTRDQVDLDPATEFTGIDINAIGNTAVRGPQIEALDYSLGHFTVNDRQPQDHQEPDFGPLRVFRQGNHLTNRLGAPFEPTPPVASSDWHQEMDHPTLRPTLPLLGPERVDHVLAHSGALPGERDRRDAFIVAGVRADTYVAPTEQPQLTYETVRGAADVPEDPGAPHESGLTRIEHWAHALHLARGGAA